MALGTGQVISLGCLIGLFLRFCLWEMTPELIKVYLHKLLPFIVSPLGLIILLIILGIAFRGSIMIILGCFVLLGSALPSPRVGLGSILVGFITNLNFPERVHCAQENIPVEG